MIGTIESVEMAERDSPMASPTLDSVPAPTLPIDRLDRASLRTPHDKAAENAPRNCYLILDATASARAMWVNDKDPDVIFIDLRRSVKPDIVCVWQHLPFKPRVFKLVNFDPPHMLYSVEGKPSFLAEKFGMLQPETWQSDFYKAFEQFLRVLKQDGVIEMKWNNNHISNARMLACLPIKPRFGSQITGSKGFRNKKSKEPRSITSWFCFIKPKGWRTHKIRFTSGKKGEIKNGA